MSVGLTAFRFLAIVSVARHIQTLGASRPQDSDEGVNVQYEEDTRHVKRREAARPQSLHPALLEVHGTGKFHRVKNHPGDAIHVALAAPSEGVVEGAGHHEGKAAESSHAHHEHHEDHHDDHHHEVGPGDLDNALGLVATACLVPTVVYFALSHGSLRAMTLKMIDVFVSIFLAVLWYSLFEQIIQTFKIEEAFPAADNLFLGVVVTLLHTVACWICYWLRDQSKTLIIFGGCAGHFIAFAAIGWATAAQKKIARLPDNPAPIVVSFALCILFGLVAFVGSTIVRKVWLRGVDHHELHEVIDEMELDILSLVLTFALTHAVGHFALGVYPATDHHESMHQMESSGMFPVYMLCWIIFLMALGSVLVPRLHTMFSSHGAVHLYKVSIIMSIAWSYLLLFSVLFTKFSSMQEGMLCQEILAVVTTFLALVLLLVLDKVETASGGWSADGRETRSLGIIGIALTAAWSWEHCYSEAFDILGQRYQMGYQGLIPKLVLAFLIPSFMLPPYIYHIKDMVIEHEEAEKADHGHGSGHGDDHGDHGHDHGDSRGEEEQGQHGEKAAEAEGKHTDSNAAVSHSESEEAAKRPSSGNADDAHG